MIKLEKTNKILGIGLPRTGTSSLAQALSILGYSTKHYPSSIRDIHHYDACSEVSFELDQLKYFYPESKYIFTTRNLEEWLISCDKQLLKYKNGWNPFWLKKDSWEEIYKNKLEEIKSLDKLLIMNICAGDGWEKLCQFLNKPIPERTFPDTNKSNNMFKFITVQTD
jgi:hypothetical protein